MTDPWKQQGRRRPYAAYSSEVAWAICDRLVEGESLRRICSDAGMPGRATVFRWIARHKQFRDRYILARDFQAEGLGEEMFEIIRDTSGDDLARARLRALERQAARMAPRKYGSRRLKGTSVTSKQCAPRVRGESSRFLVN